MSKIYFLIIDSHEIIEVNNLYTDNYLQKIRFVPNLTGFKPVKAIQQGFISF